MTESDAPGFIRISEQEARIVRLMAHGRGPERISAELGLSQAKVCSILQQLAARIEATDAAQVDTR